MGRPSDGMKKRMLSVYIVAYQSFWMSRRKRRNKLLGVSYMELRTDIFLLRRPTDDCYFNDEETLSLSLISNWSCKPDYRKREVDNDRDCVKRFSDGRCYHVSLG